MLPKGYDYFEALHDLAQYCYASAELLQLTLQVFISNEQGERRHAMRAIERAADQKCRELLEHLARDFITPLERDDIYRLAHAIDNVTDYNEEVLTRIYMFNIHTIRPEALELAKIINSCCRRLIKLFEELPNYRKSDKLSGIIREIGELEEQADELFLRAMRRLYLNTQDPIEVMVWSEAYNCLEHCCDACDTVADQVQMILLKNS